MFKINVTNLTWVNGAADDPQDLCAHGHAVIHIGGEVLEYDAAVSASALYLLRSLTENHRIEQGEQFLPCCGFAMYAKDDKLNAVDIIGCANGVDWSAIHNGNKIKLTTKEGVKTIVSLENYQREVFRFADEVEEFYHACTEKQLPDNRADREGYLAFWGEWRRRRGSKV